MRIISFENDLDSLKLAWLHDDLFTYLRHGGPPAILTEGQWQSKKHPGLSWSLVRGGFPGTMTATPAPPDVIFYDMFSSKTSADVWTLAAFQQLFAACEERAVELYTYTCSTSVRVAMLAAGFYVARGRSMGAKEQTTIALTPAAYRARWLDRAEVLSGEWLARWNRSGAKFPSGLPVEAHGQFEISIRQHAQFQRDSSEVVEP
jgi:queuine tRNA-ribosyltransferase